MAKENVGQYIKRLVLQSGMLGKLIAVNLAVFIIFVLIGLWERLFIGPPVIRFGEEWQLITDGIRYGYLAAPGDPSELIYRPWALVTQLFTHADFTHVLFNMVALFFSGRIFISFFGERRLLLTYFLGGIFGYLIHILAYYIFPGLSANGAGTILGASGAVFAIFVASAVYRPSYPVHLFGVIKLPLILIAALYVLSDLLGVGSADEVAHFAHLGGALFGGLSVINALSSKNFMNRIDRFIFKLKFSGFSFKGKKGSSSKTSGGKRRKPKMKVHQSTKASTQTDDEYNADKVAHKERIDAILEKISKKGYEGLSKQEKDILFNESKR